MNNNLNYPVTPPMSQGMPFQTNKLFCVSLQDALARPVDFNTSYVYYNQNNDEVYEVNTNQNGYKTYQVGTIKIKAASAPQGYVSQAEYDNLVQKYSELEKSVTLQQSQVSKADYDALMQKFADLEKRLLQPVSVQPLVQPASIQQPVSQPVVEVPQQLSINFEQGGSINA